MAKRTSKWTEEKIARYYAEGRGSGELSNYKPWLTIQDFPSKGRVHRIKGWKTNRVHHFFSDIERNYFYLLDWADDVIDIREQYPLNREKTVKIAEKKQIDHSVDLITRTPIVYTTDFLITVRLGDKIIHKARTTKPRQELEDKRVIEKFEIERQYWADEGIDWSIVTELELPKEMCNNISWVHGYYYMEEDIDFALTLFDFIKDKDMSILSSLKLFDKHYACEAGTAISLFRYLIAQKYIGLCMDKPLDLRVPLSSLDFSLSNKLKGRLAT
jgi:hypothetical protein